MVYPTQVATQEYQSFRRWQFQWKSIGTFDVCSFATFNQYPYHPQQSQFAYSAYGVSILLSALRCISNLTIQFSTSVQIISDTISCLLSRYQIRRQQSNSFMNNIVIFGRRVLLQFGNYTIPYNFRTCVVQSHFIRYLATSDTKPLRRSQ